MATRAHRGPWVGLIYAGLGVATLPVRVPRAAWRWWTEPFDEGPGLPALVELPTAGELLSFTFGGTGPWAAFDRDELPECDQLHVTPPM